MKSVISWRKYRSLIPAAALVLLLAVGTIAGLLEGSGLFLSKSRRALLTARVLSRVEEAHNSLNGRYFGQKDLGGEDSASVLSLVSAHWARVGLAALPSESGWVAVLEAEAPPHYVIFGGETLTIFAAEAPPNMEQGTGPPDSLPAGWTEVHSEELVPLFNPRAAAAERGERRGKNKGGGRD